MLVCTLHVCPGGLSNDNENLNWNKASMVLSKYLLTKLVSVSKLVTLSLKLFAMYVLERMSSDLYIGNGFFFNITEMGSYLQDIFHKVMWI